MINQQDDQKNKFTIFEPQKQNQTANNMSEPLLKKKTLKLKAKSNTNMKVRHNMVN